MNYTKLAADVVIHPYPTFSGIIYPSFPFFFVVDFSI